MTNNDGITVIIKIMLHKTLFKVVCMSMHSCMIGNL